MVTIISNGSKWAGEDPDSLQTLIDLLQREPLDPTFETCGNFVRRREDGTLDLWGNFWHYSHGFSIRGTEEELSEVVAAIDTNMQTAGYQEARRIYLENKEKNRYPGKEG